MRRIDLLYNGNKITYTKFSDESIMIYLPLNTDESGSYHTNVIEMDSIGWKITSTLLDNENIFSNVWVSNDGKIAYNNNSNTEIKWLDEKIDSNKKSDDPIYCRAQELYDVLEKIANQIKETECDSWSPKKVLEIRRNRLATFLKMLGYTRISDIRKKVEPSGEYAALSRVGERLKNYKNLNFVRGELNVFGQMEYLIDITTFYSPEDGKNHSSKTVIDSVEKEVQEDIQYVRDREDIIDRSRALSESYFSNMKNDVGADEMDQYWKTKIKIAKLLMGLNYDLLSPKDRENIEDLTGLSNEEVAEKITNFLDKSDFNIATDIENRFAVKEAENFIDEVDMYSQINEAFTKGQLAESLKELKDYAIDLRKEKQDKINAYKEMNKIFQEATGKTNPKNKEE